MSKISAVIIDDEINAIDVVKAKLERYFPHVEIKGTCNQSELAISLIATVQPDLVFIDIEMPTLSGFDVIKSFVKRTFEVVFITAYDKYAINAFKENALGYILKPIDRLDFIKTVSMALVRINEKRFSDIPNFENDTSSEAKKLAVLHKGEYFFLGCHKVLYFKANGSYTHIYTEKDKFLISKNLKTLEALISNWNFIKINRSYLINPSFVQGISKKSGGEVIMSDGTNLVVSQNIKESVFNQLSKDIIFT